MFNKPRSGELFQGSQKTLASISSGNKWEKFPVEKALEIAARNNQKPTSNGVDYTGPNPVTRANAGQPVSNTLFAAPPTTTNSEKAPRLVPSAEALKQLMAGAVPTGPSRPVNRS